MSEATIRGTCASCGKVFRIPSAERTYTCKACGGKVSATAPKPERSGDAHSVTPVEHVPRFGARWNETHPKSKAWRWVAAILALVIVGGGVYGYIVLTSSQGTADINVTTADLAKAWQAADLDALAQHHHPTGRAEFRMRLEAIAQQRGWQAGFPTIGLQASQVTEGTPEAPEVGASLLSYERGWVKLSWQYEPSRRRWYLYGFDLAPPPLGDRPEAFRTAWAASSTEALHPFFREDARDKWSGLLERKASQGGWGESWPALGPPRTSGEEELLESGGALQGLYKVESSYTLPGGELLVRWSHHDRTDQWLVIGMSFP